MAYYTGSAVDFGALRAALVTALASHGWTWAAATEQLSKGAAIIRLTHDTVRLSARARITSGSDTGASGLCHIGRYGPTAAYDFVWPVQYRIFVFDSPDEVYLIVNHSVDVHQFLAFGASVFDLPGTGVWLGATLRENIPVTDQGFNLQPDGSTSISGSSGATPPVLFGAPRYSAAGHSNSYVHHQFSGTAGDWVLGTGFSDLQMPGWRSLTHTQPNAWSSESILLPLRAWCAMPEYKIACVADLYAARHVRVDYYEPGQIITLGSERWMVFPWYRKSLASRNAGASSGATAHTGTLGWAIRYDGP